MYSACWMSQAHPECGFCMAFLWREMGGGAFFRPLLLGPAVWSSMTLSLSHSYPAGHWRRQLFGTETLQKGKHRVRAGPLGG